MTQSTPRALDDTFYIIDFDRTLVDSDKLLEVFIEVSQEFFAIPREQIEQADRDVKLRGDSFDTASYVKDHLKEREEDGEEMWEELEKRFIHECRALNMLLPGAAELLEWLDQNKKRHGILTYGNPLWQRIKITAAGFNHVDRIIIDQKEKGRRISQWLQEDGLFHMPHDFGGGTVKNVILVDDKAVSFAEYPDLPSSGYWVLDDAHALPSQMGDVPSNVHHVKDLFEVIEHFNSIS